MRRRVFFFVDFTSFDKMRIHAEISSLNRIDVFPTYTFYDGYMV